MNFKKHIYKIGMVGLLALTMSSCSDFLDLDPLNDIVDKKFWNEKSDVDNIVTGCYSSMQAEGVISRMMCWGEWRSDDVIGGTNVNNNASISNIMKENINASNEYTDWSAFYNIINTCNVILYKAPAVAEKDPSYTESELRATEAEVSALRDLCYFYLIRAFRDVPFTKEPFLDDTQQLAQPALPFNQVLDSLIADLESVQGYAVRKYPETKTYYQTGRITQDAIHAMLCDMYLWKQDYQSAVRYADMVIESKTKDYQNQLDKMTSISESDQMMDGYPLISDKMSSLYGEAFNEIFGDGNSRESIFELTFMNDETMLSNKAVSTFYGNATTFPGYVKPADFISNDMDLDNPTVYLDKFDARYFENMQKDGQDFGVNKYTSQSAYVTPASTGCSARWGSPYSADYCHGNWIVYRLTDVMLMKAEALVEMINEADTTDYGKAQTDTLLRQAYSIVNVINKRSNCNTAKTDIDYQKYTSKSEMAGLVQDERQRELMFEGKRWFDLVRRSRSDGNTQYLISKVSRKGSDNSSVVQSKLARMDALYWPYNKDELQVNPYLVQNPAFGSGDNNSYQTTTK